MIHVNGDRLGFSYFSGVTSSALNLTLRFLLLVSGWVSVWEGDGKSKEN
jgi:hypothetical protein